MPARNALKTYIPNSYYHIYNRGVDKRIIFQEQRDYKIFLSYLKFYLSPQINLQGLSSKVSPSRQLKNYFGKIELNAFCLMPNHFHLLVHQKNIQDINYFMRSLITKYVRAFNTHYQRNGHLFQDRYKAVLIESEDQLIKVTRYIHLNPYKLFPNLPTKTVLEGLMQYPYSSYRNYLRGNNQMWVKPKPILDIVEAYYNISYQEYLEKDL